MKKREAERGDLVRDQQTGLEGLVVAITHRLTGMPRLDIQPPSKDGRKIEDAWAIDSATAKVIFKRKLKPLPATRVKAKLGDKVKDEVTGLTGIIVSASLHLNGCTRMGVQPPLDKDGKVPDAVAFDAERLKVITPKKVKEGQRQTGGPSERIERY